LVVGRWVGKKARTRGERGRTWESEIKIRIERFVACVYVYVCKYNKETVRTVSGEGKCGKMKKIVIVG
jgi:hypothetical protein